MRLQPSQRQIALCKGWQIVSPAQPNRDIRFCFPVAGSACLIQLLFAKSDRHVTAEMLYEEATRAKVPVSLATVYNTLHQFTDFGLLRQVAVDASKTYFDTNNSAHHHFFIEDKNELIDIPMGNLLLGKIPTPPEGYEIACIDVIVRLRRRQG